MQSDTGRDALHGQFLRDRFGVDSWGQAIAISVGGYGITPLQCSTHCIL